MSEKPEQYVYIHRDESGDPVYVGRGRKTRRAVGHEDDALSAFLIEHNCSVEIAGPFHTQEVAADIEAALISAISSTTSLGSKLLNKVAGVSRATFRPLGVPADLANSVLGRPVDKEAVLAATDGRPALFVLIKDYAFADGRLGYDLAQVPSDDAIKDRMTRWWQLGSRIDGWKSHPEKIPAVLIAVSGPIKHRIIAGSLEIDRDPTLAGWIKHDTKKSFQVPIKVAPENRLLNYKGLRGCRLKPGVTSFSNTKASLFCIVDNNSESSG